VRVHGGTLVTLDCLFQTGASAICPRSPV
jgi:hypothetical protein